MPALTYVVFKLRKVGEVYGKISDQRAALNTTTWRILQECVLLGLQEKFEISNFKEK